MEKETLEGVKLIAEFMGADEYNYPKGIPYGEFSGTWQNHLHRFEYYQSWAWIMPVVEKIGKECDVRIIWMPNAIEVTDISRPDISDGEISSMGGMTAIENTFHAVVNFIKWYNTKSPNRKK